MGQDKIIAMIPARMGSTRLKKKNLALIAGEPMISYAIQAAKDSGVFSRIVVNSEDQAFGPIAKRYGVEFYLRPPELGSSEARSDEVVLDFMEKIPGDITVWVNSTSPLQTGEEVRAAVEHFQTDKLDSLITVCEEQVHCLYDGRPLNFCEKESFAKTQELRPVQRFVYSIMMWRNQVFKETYQKQGHAIFCGTTGYFPVSKETALIVKTEDDLRLVDYILTGKKSRQGYKVEYDAKA